MSASPAGPAKPCAEGEPAPGARLHAAILDGRRARRRATSFRSNACPPAPGMLGRAQRAGPLVLCLRPSVGSQCAGHRRRCRGLCRGARRHRALAQRARKSSASRSSPAFRRSPCCRRPPNDSLAKIPVTVITGFLGSGKTTLIRHLMRNPNGKRLAMLVNEFGSEGVDGEILKSCADANCPEENIVELANGCICCTVADDFIPTIEALLALPRAARSHPDRDLGAGAAEAAAEGVRLAGDPLAHHGRRRDRAGRCRGRGGRPLRARSGRGRSAARRRRQPRPRDAAVGSVRGPDLPAPTSCC